MLAEVRRSGVRGRCGPIAVTFAQVSGLASPVVGYAVGRRVGKAVVRNRLRRRLRAVVVELQPALDPGGYLVSAGPEATGLAPAELRGSLAEATRRAQVRVRKSR